MSRFSGKNSWLYGFMVLLLAVMCHVGGVQAAVTPDDPNYNAITSDPNIQTTCDNDVVYEQYNAIGTAKARIEKELADLTRASDTIDRAKKINETVRNLWFCPIKISYITGLIGMASSIAASIMAMLIAAVAALVTTLINQIVNSVCAAVIGAIQSALSVLCIPPLTINLRIPNFNFYNNAGGAACSGTPLVSVTGGPPLATPPLSYGASIPGTNWQGRVNVIQ